jgi:hypothetical protein
MLHFSKRSDEAFLFTFWFRKSKMTNSLVSLPVMKQLSGLERAHFEVMRGSFLQNEAYCAKQGTRLF